MIHDDPEQHATDSAYPIIELPEFYSTIPEHLLQDVSRENRFVMENLNIQTQYIKWLCESAVDTNHQVRKTNGRLKKVETWKEKLSAWWVAAAALITFGGTASLLVAKIFKTISSNSSISIF